MRDPGLDPIKQLVPGCIIRAVQGLLKSQFIGRAMTLEDQPAQAQQGGAVVTAVIHALFERQ